MRKIGIVSFWRNNYGSALQSYATKYTLKKLGYDADILNERYYGIYRYIHFVIKKMEIFKYVIKYRGFLKYYLDLKGIKRSDKSNLSRISSDKIEFFTKKYLQPIECSYKLLRKYADKEEVIAIVAGSDQIWNCSNGFLSPYYFLKFVPQKKRIAFAPSFGTSKVPEFLKSDIGKAVRNFDYLSVREDQGANIIKDLTGINPRRVADPVVLFTDEEWREFYGRKIEMNEQYIFIHFLDEPNEIAIKTLKMISENSKMQMICFAYHYDILKKMKNMIFVNGDPKDYVKYIDNASLICTDSFHTSMFAIMLDTLFLTFERQYKQISSQESRLITLLRLYNYEERMIKNYISYDFIKEMHNHDIKKIIEVEREKLKEFLIKSINSIQSKYDSSVENMEYIKNEIDCTGCGACSSICKHNAIDFKFVSEGYRVPQINKNLCINCKMCKRVCRSSSYSMKKKVEPRAYVAYNQDKLIRSKSASGGVFSAIANNFLVKGGVVFGATMEFNDSSVVVKHIKIDKVDNLYRILGSKYVESDCTDTYPLVKEELKKGHNVLFGGTSCQIEGLYNYLGKNDINNLCTIDLICHGVPGIKFFNDYIRYLEKKYRAKIIDFSFRKKDKGNICYVETIKMKKGEKIYVKEIIAQKSSYYKLFLLGESYRNACYNCKYASMDKPSDITIGDYFEICDDYPNLVKKEKLNEIDGISCVIAHTSKGNDIITQIPRLVYFPADINVVQRSHLQLCLPMRYSGLRYRVFNLYKKYGYKGVAYYFKICDVLLFIPRKLKYILEKL